MRAIVVTLRFGRFPLAKSVFKLVRFVNYCIEDIFVVQSKCTLLAALMYCSDDLHGYSRLGQLLPAF